MTEKQPEQARRGTQHRLLGSTTGGFQAEIGAHLLERGFDGPGTGMGFDGRARRHRRIGGEEIVVAMAGFAVDLLPAVTMAVNGSTTKRRYVDWVKASANSWSSGPAALGMLFIRASLPEYQGLSYNSS